MGTPVDRRHQASILAGASSHCPVLDVEHPSLNVTKANHVYVAIMRGHVQACN